MTLTYHEIKNIEARVKEGKLDAKTAHWIILIFSSVRAFNEWKHGHN